MRALYRIDKPATGLIFNLAAKIKYGCSLANASFKNPLQRNQPQSQNHVGFETIIDQLKNIFDLDHSLHRYQVNYLIEYRGWSGGLLLLKNRLAICLSLIYYLLFDYLNRTEVKNKRN